MTNSPERIELPNCEPSTYVRCEGCLRRSFPRLNMRSLVAMMLVSATTMVSAKKMRGVNLGGWLVLGESHRLYATWF